MLSKRETTEEWKGKEGGGDRKNEQQHVPAAKRNVWHFQMRENEYSYFCIFVN